MAGPESRLGAIAQINLQQPGVGTGEPCQPCSASHGTGVMVIRITHDSKKPQKKQMVNSTKIVYNCMSPSNGA